MDKISVLTEGEELASFERCNTASVYEKRDGQWSKVRSISYEPIPMKSMAQTRDGVRGIIDNIEDTKIVACEHIGGIPFTVFNNSGYMIFQIDCINENIFDDILSDIEENDIKKKMRENIVKNMAPVETETKGIYFLDLIMLQKECKEVTSKKALKSFLENTPFLELNVVCEHIPPWIENDNRYKITQYRKDAATYINITKAQK